LFGSVCFVLSRTVWGPPASARAAEGEDPVIEADPPGGVSDARRRYLFHQPTHWRYVMMKR
jgi:hypothetical protein